MVLKKIIQHFTCFIFIIMFVLAGCNMGKKDGNFINENSSNAINMEKNTDIVKNNSITHDELNIGNKKRLVVDDDFIYYLDPKDNNLYKIDKDFNHKEKIYEGELVEIVDVLSNDIYFVKRIMCLETEQPIYKMYSISKDHNSYDLKSHDIVAKIIYDKKLYYYKNSDQPLLDLPHYDWVYLFSYDLENGSEEVIADNILSAETILYKDKIYFRGPGSNFQFIEYDPKTNMNKVINTVPNWSHRFNNNYIYAYKGNEIHKTSIERNTIEVVFEGNKDIYNIWDANITENYIFILAQHTDEAYSESNYWLHLYRMEHDGSNLTKIYATEYDGGFIFNNQLIYNTGDKLILYDYETNLKYRAPIQVIDFNGKEIQSLF